MKKNLHSILPATLFFVLAASAAHAAGDPLASANFQSNPFQGVCQDTALISEKDYQKDKDYWDSAINDCHAPVEVLPKDSWAGWMEGVMGREQDQVEAASFLKKVGQRAIDMQDFNNKTSELWVHCAGDASAEADWFAKRQAQGATAEEKKFNQGFYDQSQCSKRLEQLKAAIRDKGSDYRVQLALMGKVAGLDTTAKNLFSPKDAGQKVPLSADEQAKVDDITQKDQAAAVAKVKDEFRQGFANIAQYIKDHPGTNLQTVPPEAISSDPLIASRAVTFYPSSHGKDFDSMTRGQTFQDSVAQYRSTKDFGKYYAQYSDDFGSLRILAYLDKAAPSNEDIAKAASQVLANGQKDLAALQAQMNTTKHMVSNCSGEDCLGAAATSTEQNMTDNELLKARIDLLKNGGAVRDVLASDPHSCRIAAGLTNFATGQNTKQSAMITAGLVAGGVLAGAVVGPAVLATVGGVSITASGVAAGAIGVGSSAFFLNSDWQNYQNTKQRTLSVVSTDSNAFGDAAGKGLSDVKDLQAAKDQFAVDAALNAAMFAGSGSVSAIRALSSSGAELAAADRAATTALQGQGKTANEAAQIVAASHGPVGAQATVEASNQIARAAGADPNEVIIYTDMLKKGALGPDFRSQTPQYSQIFHSMAPEERQKVVTAAKLFMADAKEGDFNPGTRNDAVRAAINLAKVDKDMTAEQIAAEMKRGWQNFKDWDNDSLKGLTGSLERTADNESLPEMQGIADPVKRRQAAFDKALQDMGVSDSAERRQMESCALGAAASL